MGESLELMSHNGLAVDEQKLEVVRKWLGDNYQLMEESMVLKSAVYDHYAAFCVESQTDPVAASQFGRVIGELFPSVTIQKVGAAGNTKTHYFGLAMKPAVAAAANAFMPNPQMMAAAAAAVNPFVGPSMPMYPQTMPFYDERANSYLRVPDTLLQEEEISPDLDDDQVRVFDESYRNFCQSLLSYIQALRFNEIEMFVKGFWGSFGMEDVSLLESPFVSDLLVRYDMVTYDLILHSLIPNIIDPIPLPTLQLIRSNMNHMQQWILEPFAPFNPALLEKRGKVLSAFLIQIRRYTAINYLYQSISASLDPETKKAMAEDWKKVSFEHVQEHASWICGCPLEDITRILEHEIPECFNAPSPILKWLSWAEKTVSSYIKNYRNDQVYYKEFILKWNFYGSLILKELTFKSASTFGTFHLLKMLLDEYVIYLVETKLA